MVQEHNNKMSFIQCGFTGISLSNSQNTYSVYELELTGLSWAAKKCSHYLLGNQFPVEFRTDHYPLKGLEDVSLDFLKNPHVLRLLEDLLMADFIVKYIPAAKNGIAD